MQRPKNFVISILGIGLLFHTGTVSRAEDWVLYAASREEKDEGATLQGWYALNRKAPGPQEDAEILHYFDGDSVAASSPLPGSITRVWEKSVVLRETKNYQETKQDIEAEHERELGRRITALDQAWVFPLAVRRATKETHTLFEINCGTAEFMIMEVNHYDREGNRMTREVNMDRMDLWYPIEEGSVMEALSSRICKQPPDLGPDR